MKPIERGPFRLQADVRIVFQHPPREVPCNRLDDVIWLASFEEPRYDGVPKVVEAQARQAILIP